MVSSDAVTTGTVADDAASGTVAGEPDYPVLPGLDTIRALGALLVLATHSAFWSGSYSFTFTGTLLARLDVGVPLFFVLSGFLLSRPYLRAARREERPPRLRPYLWKRAVRVLPVYWVVAVVAMALVSGNSDAGLVGWLRALTLTDIYFRDRLPDGLTQTWSLATEVSFYVLLPLIMLGWNRATRGARPDRGVLAVVALSIVVTVVWVFSQSAWVDEDLSLIHI